MTGFLRIFTMQGALLDLPYLIAYSRTRVGWHRELQGPSCGTPWASALPLAHFDCPHVGVFALADAGHWMELSLSGNLDCSVCSVLATCPSGSVTWVLRRRQDLTEIQVKCQQCPCPPLSHCLHLKSISRWGHLGAKPLATLDGPLRQKVLFKYLCDILSFAYWPAKP